MTEGFSYSLCAQPFCEDLVIELRDAHDSGELTEAMPEDSPAEGILQRLFTWFQAFMMTCVNLCDTYLTPI